MSNIAQIFQIEKLIYGGDGLSRTEGEVVLTPFVLPGEVVEAERLETRQQVQRTRLKKVLEASPDRVEAPCPVFQLCGGCQYQHIGYSAQLRAKRDILVETLRRVGKIEFEPERIGLEGGPPYGYRNRAQFHLENGRIGYRAMGSNRFVAIEECPIIAPKLNEAVSTVRRMMQDRRWPRFVSSLEIFSDDEQVQWNVLESERPVAKQFFEWLAGEVPGTVSGPLEYAVGEDVFRVSGNSFFQINRFLVHRLTQLALEGITGETAWDLYAGVGLFSLTLARQFGHVVAVESGRSAAADLKINAQRAGVSLEIAAENAEEFLLGATTAPDFVLADPPRAGLGKTTVKRLLVLQPRQIVIVACDPATLARDLAALGSAYQIDKLTLVDLFPQTFHMETIAALSLK